MTQNALTTPTSEQSKLDAPKHVARLPLVALLAVVSFSLIVGAVSLRQRSTGASLRRIAREIQPGDNLLDVDTRLGKATYGYESGWPYPGGPPTEFGVIYGGAVNDFHQELDSLVSHVFRGSPRWYFPQHFRSWPVLVQYDADKRVPAQTLCKFLLRQFLRNSPGAQTVVPYRRSSALRQTHRVSGVHNSQPLPSAANESGKRHGNAILDWCVWLLSPTDFPKS